MRKILYTIIVLAIAGLAIAQIMPAPPQNLTVAPLSKNEFGEVWPGPKPNQIKVVLYE